MEKLKLTRRQVIEGGLAGVAGLLLGSRLEGPKKAEAAGAADKLTEVQVKWIQTVSACDPDGSKMLALLGTCVVPQSKISCEHVTNEALDRAVVFEGFPSKAIQVLSPRGDSRFKATWAADLDMMIAEPGILANPNRFETIDKMPYFTTSGVGGHTAIVLQEGIVEYQGRDGKIRKVELPELQGRTHMFIFREGFNINNNKPVQLKITCGVENHGQVQHFDSGAFISEGQMGQVSLAVFTGRNLDGTPNGNTANSMFTVTEVDWNTDAFAVGSQFGMGQPFVGEKQNWK